MSDTQSAPVAVIGAGVTGLTLAHLLDRRGIPVQVFEAQDRPGGAMRTSREEGFLVEHGPNSAQETTPLLRQLFVGLGIDDQFEYASPAAKNRYVVRGGRLHTVPLGPPALLGTGLFSGAAKLRLLAEPFIRRSDPDQDEDLAHFVERRLGREFLDYAIDPFVSGVFAGLPEKLSVRSAFPRLWELEQQYGSLIRGAILGARARRRRQEQSKQSAQSFSFREGLQTLIDALARSLGDKVRTSAPLRRLRREGPGFVLELAGQAPVRARAAVLTIPAHAYAELDLDLAWEEARQALARIYYPPVAVVFCGYRHNPLDRPLEGFGFLVPRRENRQILGALWNSSLFSGRAPGGGLALTVFVGGSRQPENALWPEDKLMETVAAELKDLLGLEPRPDLQRIFRWPRAIPQYQVGHQQLIAALEACEQQHPGLYLGGNFRGGISVADCVKSAHALAERVAGALAG
jgi:oxygen-dependent protoporphyrinogen oxidase